MRLPSFLRLTLLKGNAKIESHLKNTENDDVIGRFFTMNIGRRLNKIGLIIGGILLYAGFQKIFPIGCPIKYFLHIPCAGCGMTRALREAVVGDFKMAFYYHPLYFLVPFMGGMIVFGDLFSKKVNVYFWYIVASLFAVIYGIRIILHASAIF